MFKLKLSHISSGFIAVLIGYTSIFFDVMVTHWLHLLLPVRAWCSGGGW